MEWTLQHGFAAAEFHKWQYYRVQTEEEYLAWDTEQKQLLAMRNHRKATDSKVRTWADASCTQCSDKEFLKMTDEHVIISQRPT
jgi:hypothetical protein